MNTAKHTPGPWTLETIPTSCGVCHKIGPFSKGGEKETHACIYVDYNRNANQLEANARLIAASPALLESLEQLVKCNETWNASVAGIIGRPANWNDSYLDNARAAIALAKGEA